MNSRFNSSWRLALLAAVMAAAIVGCATPAARIKQNPELFNSFPPEAQELIKKGQIDLGFSTEMVAMALGKPNRVYQRQTTNGTMEVWAYTIKRVITDRQRVNANFRYRDPSGSYRSGSDWVWVDVPREIEYDKTRVEFMDGTVIAIETLDQ